MTVKGFLFCYYEPSKESGILYRLPKGESKLLFHNKFKRLTVSNGMICLWVNSNELDEKSDLILERVFDLNEWSFQRNGWDPKEIERYNKIYNL